MKSVLTLLLCLTWFGSVAQAIQKHAIPERGDNVVIVESFDSDSLAYQNILSALASNEWFIDQQDAKTFLIRTKTQVIPALFSAETYLVVKKASSNPTVIYITGALRGSVGAQVISDEVTFKGAENAAFKKSFYKMQAIAKSYPNASVYYGRK